jgi:methyl-accepting chemotaxis protein
VGAGAVSSVAANGSVAAVMGIDMSATSQFNLLEKLYYICIAVIGGSVVLAIILSLALSRLIASPIVALRAGAERVKARDYSTQIVVKSKDELGILASTFNDMVREVRKIVLRNVRRNSMKAAARCLTSCETFRKAS